MAGGMNRPERGRRCELQPSCDRVEGVSNPACVQAICYPIRVYALGFLDELVAFEACMQRHLTPCTERYNSCQNI